MTPHGIRLGTPACTTRGYSEQHMDDVAEFLHRICSEAIRIQNEYGKKIIDFQKGVHESDEVKKIWKEVEQYAIQFDWPGLES